MRLSSVIKITTNTVSANMVIVLPESSVVVYNGFTTIVHRGSLKIHVRGTQKIWSHPVADIIGIIVYDDRLYIWDHCEINRGRYYTDELTIYDHNEHTIEAAKQDSPEILMRLVRHLNTWNKEYDCKLVDYGIRELQKRYDWPPIKIVSGLTDCFIVCRLYEN